MNKISKSILSLFILASLLSAESSAQAQKFSTNRRGIQLIGYRRCQGGSGDSRTIWYSTKEEVVIGRRLYSAIGRLSEFRRDTIYPIICPLAEVGEPPRFKTLTLSMGFSNSDQGQIQVTVYKDGNRIDSILVGNGEPVNFQADIAGGRDIAIEFSCGITSRSGWCGSNFYFFDASVK